MYKARITARLCLPRHRVFTVPLRARRSLLFVTLSLTIMATSASFHDVVGLPNGSRFQIDRKRITGDMIIVLAPNVTTFTRIYEALFPRRWNKE
ncbi:hypothetical protein BDR04DRAFT_421670 [Suillus decipiens]|nr:hypothetical protein BDR04DRAFT_421670 [Suillus decipiens]